MNSRGRDRSIPPILLIVGVALLVRLIDLGARPMWYDEAMAVMQSQKGLASMLYGTLTVENGVAANVHPLLYHTLLWIWEQIVGTEAASVRLFSVLMGIGIVVAGYYISRQLFADRVAMLTGWALAFSPFQVHYSQEARMYALLALLLLSATIVYWRALHRGRLVHWVIFAILAASAQYTHNLAAVYLVPLCATPVILRRWKEVLHTIGAGLVALVLYLPWLLHLPSQLARVQQSYWIGRPGLVELVRTLLVFMVGLPVPSWALSVAVFSAVFLVVLGVVSTVRAWKENPVLTRRAVWIVYLSAAPVGFMFLLSLFQPIYLDRAMLAAGSAFLIWIVWALDRKALVTGLVYIGYVALASSFAVGLYGFFSYRGFPYAPYQAMDDYLAAQARPGEVILHSNKISAIPAMYYDPSLAQSFLADPPQSGSNTLSRATQEMLGIEAAADVQSAVGDAEGVWFIIFPGEIQDYLSAGATQHPTLAWLEARFSIDRIVSFGELQVYHFVRPRVSRLPVPTTGNLRAEDVMTASAFGGLG
jgi:mannosyltransferase